MQTPGPPDDVLGAFGVAGHRAVPLGGGAGVSWRAGHLVLKRANLGQDELGRWAEIVAAGERLDAAFQGVPRPQFLDRRSSPWAVADRAA